MNNIIRKLGSRKLWVAIAGIAAGIAVALGADGSDIQSLAGAITTLISSVVYIVVEGRIDAESVKVAIEATQEAVEVIADGDNN